MTYSDSSGNCEVKVRDWVAPVQVYIRMEGLGTVGAARSLTESLTGAMGKLGSDDEVEVLVDMVTARGAWPRSVSQAVAVMFGGEEKELVRCLFRPERKSMSNLSGHSFPRPLAPPPHTQPPPSFLLWWGSCDVSGGGSRR